jgi:hypothetical protein
MTEPHSDWRPREHDHVVEPVFAGLRGHEELPEGGETSNDVEEGRSQRKLWIAATVVVAAILVRAWTLL